VAIVDPSSGEVGIGKMGARGLTPLTDIAAADGFGVSGANRFELTCAGDRIALSVNGIEATSANDGSFTDGGLWIGAVATGFENVAARFGHLMVTQR
jgi:hypothetical protein